MLLIEGDTMLNSKKSIGGHARANSLTQEKRKEISTKAITARWEKADRMETLPHVVLKQNDLNLAGLHIPCAIIEGEKKGEVRRVLTETGISEAILGGWRVKAFKKGVSVERGPRAYIFGARAT
jgi:hypothetical protein